THVHPLTNETPFFMMFGRDAIVPADLRFGFPTDDAFADEGDTSVYFMSENALPRADYGPPPLEVPSALRSFPRVAFARSEVWKTTRNAWTKSITKYRLDMDDQMFLSEFIHEHNLNVLFLLSGESLNLPQKIHARDPDGSPSVSHYHCVVHKVVTLKSKRYHVYVLHRGVVTTKQWTPHKFFVDADSCLIVRGYTDQPHTLVDPSAAVPNLPKLWDSPTSPTLLPAPTDSEGMTLVMLEDDLPLALEDFAEDDEEAYVAPPPVTTKATRRTAPVGLRRSPHNKTSVTAAPLPEPADSTLEEALPAPPSPLISMVPRPVDATNKELLELAKQYVNELPTVLSFAKYHIARHMADDEDKRPRKKRYEFQIGDLAWLSAPIGSDNSPKKFKFRWVGP
ncbi:hypothetical protein HDU96_002840, partial [Phlyctochytrium bullatum]